MHSAEVLWADDGGFSSGRYSRAHLWRFDGGIEVRASASPSVVPPPYSCPDAIDPEEAYIAALSSCHMLWFLDIAHRKGHSIERYHDTAKGALVRDGGMIWIRSVTLNVQVTWGVMPPTRAAHEALHDAAHTACFLANSVKTEINVHILET